jgi:peptidoglycan/LPS O-acetylase OafA/YrhL
MAASPEVQQGSMQRIEIAAPPHCGNSEMSETRSGTAAGIESRPSERIRALDGVRGLAILLVLLFHFSSYGHGLPPASIAVDRMFQVLTRSCWVGVDLFFVLSGFLITRVLYDSKASTHYFRNFYARRVLRIFPLYYGALVLFFLVLPRLVPESNGIGARPSEAFWYWTYLSNIRIARDGWQYDALGHFWSLAVEEQFYLGWPVVILFFRRTTLIRICLCCIGGSLVARVALILAGYQPAAYVLTPARMDALAVGAVLALIARGPARLTGIGRWASPAAALLGLLLGAIFVWRRGMFAYDPVVSTLGLTLLACLFGTVLVLALTASRQQLLGRIFSSSVLCFFGRYSYALYVFHHPILFFKSGLLPLGWVPTVFGSLLLKMLVFVMTATALSIVLALMSWHLYEKQFLKLKRFVPYQPDETDGTPQRSQATAACSRPPLASYE